MTDTTKHHEDCDVYQATLAREVQDFFGILLPDDEELIEPGDYSCNSGCKPQRTISIVITTPDDDGDWRVAFEIDGEAPMSETIDYGSDLGGLLPNVRDILTALDWSDNG